MISSAAFKIACSLAAVFGCGGVCGYTVAARQLMHPAGRAQMEDRWIESRRREDARRLQLTAEQTDHVRPAYQQMQADLRAVREEATRGVIGAVTRNSRAVYAQLTPAQQAEFAKLVEDRRTRWERANSR